MAGSTEPGCRVKPKGSSPRFFCCPRSGTRTHPRICATADHIVCLEPGSLGTDRRLMASPRLGMTERGTAARLRGTLCLSISPHKNTPSFRAQSRNLCSIDADMQTGSLDVLSLPKDRHQQVSKRVGMTGVLMMVTRLQGAPYLVITPNRCHERRSAVAPRSGPALPDGRALHRCP